MSRPIRIGVDARELLGEKTGVGRYLGELLRRWVARADAATREFVLYAPEPLACYGQSVRVLPGGRGTFWEQTSLRQAARRDNLDVFFAPAYTAPVGLRVPLAVTIHDISFIARPDWFRPRERWRRRLVTSHAARKASVVFTDSEFSKTEIQRHLPVEPNRLIVIPPGVSTKPRTANHSIEPRTANRGIEPRTANRGIEPRTANREPRLPLVLFVGSLFNRRRLPDLIAAFALATRDLPAARLAIVGADRTWPKQDLELVAAAHDVAGRVDIREYVSDDELEGLYARASVFAFLSEYEGFGLTPLEALYAGVPIVVLDTPIAREVYGPAAAYVPHGLKPTAAALRRFLTSPDAADEQLAHAPAVLARYSWERAAEQTLQHIDRIARSRDRR